MLGIRKHENKFDFPNLWDLGASKNRFVSLVKRIDENKHILNLFTLPDSLPVDYGPGMANARMGYRRQQRICKQWATPICSFFNHSAKSRETK